MRGNPKILTEGLNLILATFIPRLLLVFGDIYIRSGHILYNFKLIAYGIIATTLLWRMWNRPQWADLLSSNLYTLYKNGLTWDPAGFKANVRKAVFNVYDIVELSLAIRNFVFLLNWAVLFVTGIWEGNFTSAVRLSRKYGFYDVLNVRGVSKSRRKSSVY